MATKSPTVSLKLGYDRYFMPLCDATVVAEIMTRAVKRNDGNHTLGISYGYEAPDMEIEFPKRVITYSENETDMFDRYLTAMRVEKTLADSNSTSFVLQPFDEWKKLVTEGDSK